MTTNILFNALVAHPWLASLIIDCAIIVLHLPYRVEIQLDSSGREYGVYQSLLYRYEYGPTYERLDYDGLRRLQRIILDLLRDAWALLRGDVLRRLVDELRRRLGL
jgi:hypothetical protein